VFTWDLSQAKANVEKHGVPFEEAATAFCDANGLDWDELSEESRERRFKRLGLTANKWLVLVLYTIRRTEHDQETVRIISARHASEREGRAYLRFAP
jgi:uncharacterized DUF497 family protein